MTTKHDLQEHVAALAASLRITINDSGTSRPRAVYARKDQPASIKINPVKSWTTYIVALHEIGHIAIGKKGRRMDQEWRAWEWAILNSLTAPPAKAYAHIVECLGSYLGFCLYPHGYAHRMKMPGDGDPFWDFLADVVDEASPIERPTSNQNIAIGINRVERRAKRLVS